MPIKLVSNPPFQVSSYWYRPVNHTYWKSIVFPRNFQYRVPQKMCLLYSTAFGHSHFFLEFPLQKVILALDLVTPRVGNLDAWFNSHSNFNACRIWRFENRTPILFFYQAPNPRVVVEMSFYKHVIWCNLKKNYIFKTFKNKCKITVWLAGQPIF